MFFEHMASRNKRIGVLSEEDEYAQGLLKAFLMNNTDKRVQIISENYVARASGFRSTLSKFKQREVEAF